MGLLYVLIGVPKRQQFWERENAVFFWQQNFHRFSVDDFLEAQQQNLRFAL